MLANDSLMELVAGEKVIVTGGWNDSIRVIDRITDTQIVIGSQRYDRKTGFLRGSDRYSRSYLVPVTAERADKIYRRIYVERIRAVTSDGLSEVPTSTLKGVCETLGII